MIGRDAVPYYDRDAETFAARYASVTFEAVHPLLLRHLPKAGLALDIGAGTGRDAFALAARGFLVTAVEPSDAFRRIGEAAGEGIRWMDDRLPQLESLIKEARCYDLILCSAVLMLIPPADLAASFRSIAALLAPQGRLALSVRPRVDSEPSELFFSHSVTMILAAGEAAALECLDRVEAGDALGRQTYNWQSFIFGKQR